MALGMGVGIVAGLGLLVGFEPSRLPPAVLDLAAYKLTFIAAVGLLIAGAAVVRYGRRDAPRDAGRVADARQPTDETPRLGEGAPPMDVRRADERVRERRT
jgi:hypothetical protein